MAQQGFLMVTMEPASSDEKEFHDWYDTEHLPERAVIKGFINAQRWVCTHGWPRYVATYDLTSISVVSEPGYLAVSGDRFSPWSKRILSRMHGLYRFEGVQVHPGAASMGGKGHPACLAVLRFRGGDDSTQTAILKGLDQAFGDRSGHLQSRLMKASGDGPADYVALVEFRTPLADPSVDARAFGPAAAHLDLVNVYAPYWRREALRGVPR